MIHPICLYGQCTGPEKMINTCRETLHRGTVDRGLYISVSIINMPETEAGSFFTLITYPDYSVSCMLVKVSRCFLIVRGEIHLCILSVLIFLAICIAS